MLGEVIDGLSRGLALTQYGDLVEDGAGEHNVEGITNGPGVLDILLLILVGRLSINDGLSGQADRPRKDFGGIHSCVMHYKAAPDLKLNVIGTYLEIELLSV